MAVRGEAAEEAIIPIREDVLPDVRKLALLINHHESILASIKAEMTQILRLAHGVNLSAPGTLLDVDGGVIVQRAAQPGLSVVPNGPPESDISEDEQKA